MDEVERVLARLERIEATRGEAGMVGRVSPELLRELRALVADTEQSTREKSRAEVEGMR
jgi:hypothetical protein